MVDTGKINLILGPMFSGKTSELIARYKRYSLANKKCIMIKYAGDMRYSNKMVVTHDNVKINAYMCSFLYELDKMVQDYHVICIDEVQFYKDAHILCDKWASEGKKVEACGLNGTFQRRPFTIISQLIPFADNITFLKAVCIETGGKAIFSKRLIDNNDEQIIGGADIYSPVDRATYYNGLNRSNYSVEKIKELIKIWCIDTNIRYDDTIFDQLAVKKYDDYGEIIKNVQSICTYT